MRQFFPLSRQPRVLRHLLVAFQPERADPAKLPFNWQTGNKLMSVAANATLTDCSHVNNRLPSDWSSLYALSRIEPPKLKELGEVEEPIGGVWVEGGDFGVVRPWKTVAPAPRSTSRAGAKGQIVTPA